MVAGQVSSVSVPLSAVSMTAGVLVHPSLGSYVVGSHYAYSESRYVSPAFGFVVFDTFTASFAFVFRSTGVVALSNASSTGGLLAVPGF